MKRIVLKSIIMLAALATIGVVVMLLWNAIIPSVIGWGAVSYLQAVGLFLLSRILFGSLSRVRERANVSIKSGRELRQQLNGMTPEQKQEYIREYMKSAK